MQAMLPEPIRQRQEQAALLKETFMPANFERR
jgi:hypothetical protein